METKISRDAILRHLRTKRFGRTLKILDECTSTNDVATVLAEENAPEGLVVISETQSAGRGRFAREWSSPRGGFWLSMLFRPPERLGLVDSLPLAGALSVAKSVDEKWRIDARVRWPNDVVVHERKLAGVLAESISKGNTFAYIILGLGINANFLPSEIPSIRGISTSLMEILGGQVDREELICEILRNMEEIYDSETDPKNGALLQMLRSFDCSRGRRVRVRTAKREFAGLVDDYESLNRVRITTQRGIEMVDTATVLSVDYERN